MRNWGGSISRPMPPPPHHNALPVAACCCCWLLGCSDKTAASQRARSKTGANDGGDGSPFLSTRFFSVLRVCMSRLFPSHSENENPNWSGECFTEEKRRKQKKSRRINCYRFPTVLRFLKRKKEKKKLTHFLFDAVVRL